MATATDVRGLTSEYRSSQVQRATLVATLVALYWREKVDAEDPAAVDAWLNLMIPRVLGRSDEISKRAARYATDLRLIELPRTTRLDFDPVPGSTEQQIRTSLAVVGPRDFHNKMREIRSLDVSPVQERALVREAKQLTAAKIMASTLRHAQSGGRNTLQQAAKEDPAALGYVRVTRAKPCFFCAMLASRGLVFAEDSFDVSDVRFVGEGTAKVHDKCQCTMKPVYDADNDPILADTAKFTDMWTEWGAGGSDPILTFRRGYEHWAKTGEMLDFGTVNDAAKFRARHTAA